MTRRSQKELEVRAVQHLRDVFSDFPRDARIEPADDPLDVKLTLPSGSCIGIEVTKFVRDPSPKGSALDAHQSLTRRIADAAELTYARIGALPLYVQVRFDRSLSCSARHIQGYADGIARQVARIADGVYSSKVVASIPDPPVGVEAITVRPMRVSRPQFAVSYSDRWQYVTPEDVEHILDTKEAKLPFYRRKCGEIWLLIYVEPSGMSGWVEPPENAVLKVRTTPFDRVLFLYDASRLLHIVTDA